MYGINHAVILLANRDSMDAALMCCRGRNDDWAHDVCWCILNAKKQPCIVRTPYTRSQNVVLLNFEAKQV